MTDPVSVMHRHAPEGYDPDVDDMTVVFAMALADQDRELEKLRAENERLRAALVAVKTAYDSASWTGAIAMAMPAVRAALADEQIADK